MTRKDLVVLWALTVVVALAAATLSFATLRDLAATVGFTPSLAWLLPIIVDLGALFASLVWLAGSHTPRARRLAKRTTWSLLVLSIAGNAVQHALSATADQWPRVVLVVLVSAVAPAVFGALVHLATLARERPVESDPVETAAEVVEEASTAVGLPFTPTRPTRTVCHVYRLYDDDDELLYVGVGYDVSARCRQHKRKKDWWSEVVRGSVTTYPTRRDALVAERDAIDAENPRHNVMPGGEFDQAASWPGSDWTQSDPTATRENIPPEELHAPERSAWVVDDQTLAARVTKWAAEEGSMPSRERIRVQYGVGSKRAERIRTMAFANAGSDSSQDPTDPQSTAEHRETLG